MVGGMNIVMTIVMTIVMVMTMVMTIMTQMMGTLPFPKQQYTPEQRASVAIMNSQK